jgi:membrane associated rhomboid family serine protease
MISGETPRFSNMTLLLMALTGVTSLFVLQRNDLIMKLLFMPGAVGQGLAPWQCLTYAFVVPDMLTLLFKLLFLWFVSTPLEREWGSAPWVVFFLIATLGAAGAAWLLAQVYPAANALILYGPGAALLGLIWSYGRINPEASFLFMFVIPVRAKYFVLLYVGFRILGGGMGGLLLVLVEACGALLGLAARSLPGLLASRATERRKERLRAVPKDTGEEKLQRANTELLERSRQGEADTELAKRENEVFPFEVCPPGDFGEEDRYCRSCEAFGHCLAKRKKNRSG